MSEIFGFFEFGVYILLLVALGMSISIVRTFGNGILNLVFASFGASIFFLAVYFIFMRLAEDQTAYQLSEPTMFLWSHLIVYLSMFSLIWGGYRIKKAVEDSNAEGLNKSDGFAYGLLTFLMLVMILLPQPVEEVFAPVMAGSFVDTLGLHHFTVFILGGISFWYLRYIKGNWGLLSQSMSFIMYFLLLIGVQHLWETITESWKLIELELAFIEGVEIVIIFAALILFCIGQRKILKFIKA